MNIAKQQMEVIMDRLGKLVKEKREKRGETRKQLAKALGCSEAFARHIEMARIVPISQRLITGLKRHYRFPDSTLERAAAARNRVGRAYYRNWRKSA